jgi:hypothetical protein
MKHVNEDEVRRMYANIGDEGIDSNGHGEAKEESMNLVKTIIFFQKDVQSYKDDNDRIMKAKEEKYGFNIKLLQSLDKIDKKMDKETDSSKSRRHKSHHERIKKRSFDMHHLTLQDIQLGEHAIVQAHILSGSIQGGFGWMSYREK